MKFRVIVRPEQYRDTWRVYCPIVGDDIGRGFESEDAARSAAERFGLEVADTNEFEDVKPVDISGESYTSLRWWIANNDLDTVRKGYSSLLLYEARIRACERDGNDATKYMYEGLAVGTSVMLEMIADDIGGHYYPHFMWTNLAQHENEQAKLRGEKRITTVDGTCELV